MIDRVSWRSAAGGCLVVVVTASAAADVIHREMEEEPVAITVATPDEEGLDSVPVPADSEDRDPIGLEDADVFAEWVLEELLEEIDPDETDEQETLLVELLESDLFFEGEFHLAFVHGHVMAPFGAGLAVDLDGGLATSLAPAAFGLQALSVPGPAALPLMGLALIAPRRRRSGG